jgi:hypothetical protein
MAMALTITVSTLTGCGGAFDSNGSFATTVASTAGVIASNETETARKSKKLAESTTDNGSGATSTGSTAETASTATTTSPAPTTSTATDVTVAATTTNVTASATTSTSSPTALDVASDPRTRYWLDADKAASEHTDRNFLQLHDGTAAAPGNSGSKPVYLKQLSADGYVHADGTPWVKRQVRSDGKWAFTLRLKAGQPTFQGDTVRAEIGAVEGPGWEHVMLDERGGDYWGAQELWFDNDGAAQGGFGSGTHNITWRSAPYYSEGHSFATHSNSTLFWTIVAPEGGRSWTYDVRNGASTSPVDSALSGGNWGTSTWWKLWDIQANVPIKLVWRVRFSKDQTYDPLFILWRKVGSGPMVKVVETREPNTFSSGYRYWKTGGYVWGVSNGYSGSTRTYRLRSDLWMNVGTAPGRAELSADTLMAWLDR